MLLDGSRSTILMEDALGDSGEDVYHGIHASFLRLFRHVHDPQAVGHEFSVEEGVHHPQLQDDVKQAEEFAGPVAECVEFVALEER